jgi:hypothetical protein
MIVASVTISPLDTLSSLALILMYVTAEYPSFPHKSDTSVWHGVRCVNRLKAGSTAFKGPRAPRSR